MAPTPWQRPTARRYSWPVETYDLAEAARRIGIEPDGPGPILRARDHTPDADGRFTQGHLRRAGLVKALVESGIPLEGLGEAIRSGQVSLDFLDAPAFERFSALSGDTFAEVAERTGVPVEQLLFVREARAPSRRLPTIGCGTRSSRTPTCSRQPSRQASPGATHQMIRVHGDSLRRLAETEAEMWQSEVVRPALGGGKRPDEILGADFGDRMSLLTERSVLAMYHLQQARAWTGNIIENLEVASPTPACTAGSSIRRRCASSTSAATRD